MDYKVIQTLNFKIAIFTFVVVIQFSAFSQRKNKAENLDVDTTLLKYFPKGEISTVPSISYSYLSSTASIDTFTLNARPRYLIDSINLAHSKLTYQEGYRILVYQGTEKDAALKAKEQLYKILPNSDIHVVFKQPLYRVKFGDFTSKLEAHKVLEKMLKRQFPNAIIISENVFIKK